MVAARLFRSIVGIAAAATIGILAASLQLRGWAPMGLLPILAGVAVGAVLSAVVRPATADLINRLILGVILLSFVAVVAEHAWLYRDFRRQWRDARADNAQVALFRPDAPWSPSEYFAHEFSPRRAMLWCIDALIIVASAIATVLILRHPPSTTEY